MKLTKRSKYCASHCYRTLVTRHRILDSVSDAQILAKMPVDKFTDLFVKG